MQIGNFNIASVSGGRFRLDGGAMFGVVPKPLWNRKSAADDFNRIQLDTNCLLIRSPEALILCDTGFGSKLSDKEKTHVDAVASESLLDNLAKRGISRDDITHVIFSHLHFDHAGGATSSEDTVDESGGLQVTFPNATHVIQKREIDDALNGIPELEGNYYSPELEFLRNNANCLIVEGDTELFPGIDVRQTGGHTFGHQTIWIQSDNKCGVYLGDICPTSAHLNVFWTMAYDAYQLEVRRQKFALLSRIAETGTVLFFDHDPEIRAATIRAKSNKVFEIDQVYELD